MASRHCTLDAGAAPRTVRADDVDVDRRRASWAWRQTVFAFGSPRSRHRAPPATPRCDARDVQGDGRDGLWRYRRGSARRRRRLVEETRSLPCSERELCRARPEVVLVGIDAHPCARWVPGRCASKRRAQSSGRRGEDRVEAGSGESTAVCGAAGAHISPQKPLLCAGQLEGRRSGPVGCSGRAKEGGGSGGRRGRDGMNGRRIWRRASGPITVPGLPPLPLQPPPGPHRGRACLSLPTRSRASADRKLVYPIHGHPAISTRSPGCAGQHNTNSAAGLTSRMHGTPRQSISPRAPHRIGMQMQCSARYSSRGANQRAAPRRFRSDSHPGSDSDSRRARASKVW